MAEKVKVWFDPEGDFLEVQFREAPGYMRETSHDAVMERVDEQGNVLGFTIRGGINDRTMSCSPPCIPCGIRHRDTRK